MEMLRVGITGLVGFIGSHLRDRLVRQQNIRIVPFEDAYFSQPDQLRTFLANSDVVVHLAAMNRGDEKEIYDVNVGLVTTLVEHLKSLNIRPYVIFPSSTQAVLDNAYGRSKKEGERILEIWANENNAPVTVLVIPNVYGDSTRPFYNSVVATFCYVLTHGQRPEVQVDKELSLIYINELTEIFWEKIKNPPTGFERVEIQGTATAKVTEILALLNYFRKCYYERRVVPAFANRFQQNLYNVFLSYAETSDYQQELTVRTDDRGSLFEIVKQEKDGQIFFSTTRPGIVRGNHYHAKKMEKFCVVQGEAVIRLRRIGTDNITEYKVSGQKPVVVEILIFHTHNIENVGKNDLHTLFWTNELYNSDDSDTFYEKV